MGFREWSRALVTGERPGNATIPDPDPEGRSAADRLLEDYRREARERAESRTRDRAVQIPGLSMVDVAPASMTAGRQILELNGAPLMAVVRAAVDLSVPKKVNRSLLSRYFEHRHVGLLLGQILRRKLPYSETDIDWLLARLALPGCGWDWFELCGVSLGGMLRSIERWSRENEFSESARDSLERLRAGLTAEHLDSQGRKAVALIDQMLGTSENSAIDDADDWGYFASEALTGLEPTRRKQWTAILVHAASIPGTRPSKTWLRETRTQIESFGEAEFSKLAEAFLGLLDRPTRGLEYRRDDGYDYPTAFIADRNADAVKGLAWAVSTLDSENAARLLGAAALACFKKIPNFGSRSTKAGNACIHALAATSVDEAVIQLKHLETRLKLPSARNQVEQALINAANSRGVTPEDLDDLATPDFGLSDGVRRITVGAFTAVLSVGPGNAVDLSWLREDGASQKSVPAAVKRDHPDELKEIRRTRKALQDALAVQRARIEQLMARDRSWSLADWRSRYGDHPLVSLIARRLIWTFEQNGTQTTGSWLDGRIVDVDDRPLDVRDDGVSVRIWHPIEAAAGEVAAWRAWLERNQVTQPFKQAHRELYVLTAAELETGDYSNRFAAHIIRQHQFNALCRERGWRYSLQGAWDSHNVPTLDMHWCGLRAEFWVEGIETNEADLSHAGIYLYASTDQVRFLELRGWQSVALADIPPKVFSEVMRDVDLFVGVSSIGADPNWLDAGEARLAGYGDYWWNVSFGDLSASAMTRREVLERLLPRMAKLEGRWELDERFLKIQGELRSYKIHLGSGNILMSPNDQYLCIVPGRGAGGSAAGDGLFLPFEGDQTLSVILSKALMLVDDTSIKDPTIIRQIGSR